MADTFVQFSEELSKLTAEEAAWLKEQLQPIVVFDDREFAEDDPAIATLPGSPDFTGPRFLRDKSAVVRRYDWRGFEFTFLYDEETLWLHCDSHATPKHAAWLVQKFLKRFRPDQCWWLTYATSCSNLRTGEFSGGAVFVTAAEITFHTVYDFVQQQRATFGIAKSVRGVFDHILGENDHGETKPTEP